MTGNVLKVTLKQFLADNGLSAYRLAKAANLPEQTVYSIVREHRKPAYDSINTILNALSVLVGRTVAVSEILEFTPDAPTIKPRPDAPTPERDA